MFVDYYSYSIYRQIGTTARRNRFEVICLRLIAGYHKMVNKMFKLLRRL